MTTPISLERKLDKRITSLLKNSTNSDNGNGKGVTYEEFLSDKMLIIKAIHKGIPYDLFDLIQKQGPFSENDWAEFLDLSLKSLQRYKSGSKSFRPIHSERIIEIAEVTKEGLETFGSMEKFQSWLNTPSFALGRMKPKDLLRNSYGKDLILGQLTRFNYGIFI